MARAHLFGASSSLISLGPKSLCLFTIQPARIIAVVWVVHPLAPFNVARHMHLANKKKNFVGQVSRKFLVPSLDEVGAILTGNVVGNNLPFNLFRAMQSPTECEIGIDESVGESMNHDQHHDQRRRKTF